MATTHDDHAKAKKRLTLNRETIRDLTPKSGTDAVRGGMALYTTKCTGLTCTSACETYWTCSC